MLPELFLTATAAAVSGVRAAGLRSGAVALWSRATRRRRDWAQHEDRCRAVVRQVAAELPRCRHVLVLGSGLLRDVDVPFLAETFERVTLADAVHLLPARLAARRWPNVSTVLLELTGALRMATGDVAERKATLAPFAQDPTLDLVISANALSQLPLGAEAMMARAAKLPPDLPELVVRWHLADLAAFPCRVCLLTDVSYRVVRRDGTVEELVDLVRGAALPDPAETWDWPVAPLGEVERDRAYIHRVHAFPDFHLPS